MEIGRCPRCSCAYSASEIAGFGILRPRAARSGGPRMEYTCQSCGRMIHLIPHGEGRYAPPGEPPPAYVPEEQRRPPWIEESPPPVSDDAYEVPVESLPPEDEPEEAHEEAAADTPIGLKEAVELLGVSPAAEAGEIEQAFRKRSLTCHPDKVAHLDAEFRELAERKFKRLQKAYELLTS